MGLLKGKRVLVTAGPTREAIDPVRFISNRSSGKMGYALARAARDFGARVTLVSGPVSLAPPQGMRVVPVETADEMRCAVLREWPATDILLMVAAVADFIPLHPRSKKMKKNHRWLRLRLRPAPDILAAVSKRRRRGQIVIGFAAETEDLIRNAKEKLVQKKLDAIFVNPVGSANRGFEADRNRGWLLCKDQRPIFFKSQTKETLAKRLIKMIIFIKMITDRKN